MIQFCPHPVFSRTFKIDFRIKLSQSTRRHLIIPRLVCPVLPLDRPGHRRRIVPPSVIIRTRQYKLTGTMCHIGQPYLRIFPDGNPQSRGNRIAISDHRSLHIVSPPSLKRDRGHFIVVFVIEKFTIGGRSSLRLPFLRHENLPFIAQLRPFRVFFRSQIEKCKHPPFTDFRTILIFLYRHIQPGHSHPCFSLYHRIRPGTTRAGNGYRINIFFRSPEMYLWFRRIGRRPIQEIHRIRRKLPMRLLLVVIPIIKNTYSCIHHIVRAKLLRKVCHKNIRIFFHMHRKTHRLGITIHLQNIRHDKIPVTVDFKHG